MIKFFKFLFLSSLIISMNACSDDDDSSSSEMDEIVGSWKAKSFEFDTKSTIDFAGIETSSETSGSGSNLDYTLVFEESTYSTSGGYDVDVTTSSNGEVLSMSTQSYSDVDGSGSYSTQDDLITIKGSFYEFEVDGVDLTSGSQEQTVTFKLEGNQLTFIQDEQKTETINGISTVTHTKSTSVWERQ